MSPLSKRTLYLLISSIPLYISLWLYLFPSSSNILSTTLLQFPIKNFALKTISSIRPFSNMSEIKVAPRLSQDRGHANHEWLKTFHTFSFASYVDRFVPKAYPKLFLLFNRYQGSTHDKYGSLRVINEDRVAAGTGFGTHSHKEFEIFSYVVDGELQQ